MAPNGKLAGRRVVVTGASRGIGLAVAALFLKEGARVVGVARRTASFDAFADRFSSLQADLAEPGAAAAVADAVKARLGALDILVNNAGAVFSRGEFETEEPGVLERTLALNLLGPHRLTLALLPLLRAGREPRVINVSSGAGISRALGDPGLSSYRLSKWALNGWTMLQAARLPGIAVNALDPGWVKTDMGGPEAPGAPEDSAAAALALAVAPFAKTGKIWCGGREVPF